MKRFLILLSSAGMAAAQSTAAFEVASIKPNVSGGQGMVFNQYPGRIAGENQTLKNLLLHAYEVRDFQILGGPGWIDSDRFDVEAKAEGNPSPERITLMLQTLLADRFKLALHRDTKELPIYALTVAKGGIKLQPSDCIDPDPNSPPPQAGQSPSCGYLAWGRDHVDATKASMADFAKILSRLLGRTVVDKTGITERFPIHLKFIPDEVAAGDNSADAAGPSIFTAVQEQLGLKLESGKGPVEVLVIDHAEKPSEN